MTIASTFAVLWVLILTIGGGLLTKIDSWYFNLKKPAWQPPDWLFGPAWTIILGFAGLAFWLSWEAALAKGEGNVLISLYLINGFLHFLWSPLFFKAKRPDWALVEVPFLWLSVIAITISLRDYSFGASLLTLPYLLWVSFASALNWKIFHLNKPFFS